MVVESGWATERKSRPDYVEHFSILPESAKNLLGDGDDDSRAKNGPGFK